MSAARLISVSLACGGLLWAAPGSALAQYPVYFVAPQAAYAGGYCPRDVTKIGMRDCSANQTVARPVTTLESAPAQPYDVQYPQPYAPAQYYHAQYPQPYAPPPYPVAEPRPAMDPAAAIAAAAFFTVFTAAVSRGMVAPWRVHFSGCCGKR